jgi:hypothetical protein
MGSKVRRGLVTLAAVLSAAALGAPAAQAHTTGFKAAPPADPDEGRDIQLILDYRVARTCSVHPNYPDGGVIGNDISWTITTTDIVGWRYNVNDTWAMVSDKKYRNDPHGHPWWGFVQRNCIGGSVGGEHFPTPTSHYPAGQPIPNRMLEGRSQQEPDHFKKVDFSPSAAPVINDHKRIASMGTLRDAANNFVIGNVFPDWHVHQTDQHNAGWTKVYVPNAKRWGWVEDMHF